MTNDERAEIAREQTAHVREEEAQHRMQPGVSDECWITPSSVPAYSEIVEPGATQEVESDDPPLPMKKCAWCEREFTRGFLDFCSTACAVEYHDLDTRSDGHALNQV